MTSLSEQFGLVIRRHRQARRWSQEELAERAGLSRSYGGEVERGNSIPSLETIAKLAQALGLEASTLVAEVESQGRLANRYRPPLLQAQAGK